MMISSWAEVPMASLPASTILRDLVDILAGLGVLPGHLGADALNRRLTETPLWVIRTGEFGSSCDRPPAARSPSRDQLLPARRAQNTRTSSRLRASATDLQYE